MERLPGKFLVDENNRTYYSASGQGKQGGALEESKGGDSHKVEKYSGTLDRDDYIPTKPVAAMSYGQRVRIARLYSGHEEFLDQVIRVAGWAKSRRGQKEFCFVELNDAKR